jgi:hypothetical protein
MSISYNIIQREVALRSAQIEGTSQSTLETAYTGAWAGSLDGAEINESSFKEQILNVESEIAHIIASDVSHPYRTYIYGISAALSNLGSTPTLDGSSNPFIGMFDSCVDGTTGQPLTVQPTETLFDYEDSFFNNADLYNYCIVGNTIQHTRTTAKLQGCVWNRATQDALYDSGGDSPLPPILANTWIAGVMGNLGQIGWEGSSGVIGMYSNLYQQGIQILRIGSGGQVNLPLASQNTVAG